MAKGKQAAKRKAKNTQTAARKKAQRIATAARKKAKAKTMSPPPAAAPDAITEPARGRQRLAKTAAKQARVKQAGLDSRFRGHVSARGKRGQGRRDSRG